MTVETLPPDVASAVDALTDAFPDRVSVEAHDAIGTVVRIRDVGLGSGWSRRSGDLWFTIPFHYPDAAIYPYYVTEASPTPGIGGGALQQVGWRGMSATQVSLRHTAWDPLRDTALGSVLLTQAWLRSS